MAPLVGFVTTVVSVGSDAFVGCAVEGRSLRKVGVGAGSWVMRSGKARFQRPQQQSRPGMPDLPEDGTPVFALYVRSSTAKIWYPLGALKGDERSKGLVQAAKGNQWGKRMSAEALDKGVARTVFADLRKTTESAIRQYPQLKTNRDALEFGYKVFAKGIEKDNVITLVTKEMSLNFLDWVKSKLGLLK
mmetsp:Transcript_8600/g.17421  ORF Transcript_8600/g.17421 Transcript_8600/m.17421 type:complete len:189 (-) Transcript_8600:2908-3474(-)